MQPELAVDEVELGRRDQPAMRDAHTVERAVKIGFPEIEKAGELGKARREIVVLPDIALQQHLMIRKAVDDLRRSEREAFELSSESRVGHGPPACLLFLPRLKCYTRTRFGSRVIPETNQRS